MQSPNTSHPMICVYCGARDGNDPAYSAIAEETGKMLGANGWGLVYGAGDIGLMGRVARSAQAEQVPTLGVIPEHLVRREVGKRDLDRLVVTETMHERKKVMFMNAHAVVVLPGGAGTLDEFFEVLTWRQIGLHDKPIFLLNVGGYWDPLVTLIDHVIEQGFAGPENRDYLSVVGGIPALETALRDALS